MPKHIEANKKRKAMAKKRTPSSIVNSKWTMIFVVAVVSVCGTLLLNNSFAARPGSGGSTSGSCAVTPNPVAVGADYTITGTNLGANAVVNLLLTDSHQTTSWNLQADASGTSKLVWHSYWTGTTTATYNKSAKHGSTTVATCSFTVT